MSSENFDCKYALKIGLLTLVAVATTFSAITSYQVKGLLSNGAAPSAPAAEAPAAPAAEEPAADQPSKKPSDYHFGIPYEKAVKAKKPMIVLFYADWCGFCVRFMPIYEELYKNHKNQFNFVKVNVEDNKYEAAVKKYEIAAFPTVFMVNTKTDKREQLKNENFGDMNKLDELMNDFYNKNK
ncbi:thioredoxin fold domain-containing protein [bacterium]|nr:thioredoxin fold domain-containing protein [bacterium]